MNAHPIYKVSSHNDVLLLQRAIREQDRSALSYVNPAIDYFRKEYLNRDSGLAWRHLSDLSKEITQEPKLQQDHLWKEIVQKLDAAALYHKHQFDKALRLKCPSRG